MSRFSRISKIFIALATMCLALIVIPAAFAGDGNSLTAFGQKDAAAKQAPPTKTLLAHHGLELKFQLNEKVMDGKTAKFYATITNHGKSVQFTNAQIVVLFDGQGQFFHGVVTNAHFGLDGQKAANPQADFVDLGKQQIRMGTLAADKTYKIDGQVAVPDRSILVTYKDAVPAKSLSVKNITFFCAKVVVTAQYPGKPNAGWPEESQMNCRQYSVPTT